MSESFKVLIIEDEAGIRKFLRAGLDVEPDSFFEAETGKDGIRLAAQKQPDVILLDLGLPDLDGLEVLAQIRDWSEVPIIILSARGKEADKVTALDSGADDYLTKPFSVPELLARIRAALRHRRPAEAPSVFSSGGLTLDPVARQVSLDDEELRLTQIEYRLLSLLVRHAGMAVTQKQLLAEVWGPGYEESTHALRVHMGNLRQKLKDGQGGRRFIRTETGVGYRLLVG